MRKAVTSEVKPPMMAVRLVVGIEVILPIVAVGLAAAAAAAAGGGGRGRRRRRRERKLRKVPRSLHPPRPQKRRRPKQPRWRSR